MPALLLNIPKHKNCTNCGSCCGVTPVNRDELAEINEYVKNNNIVPIVHKDGITCPFRDEKERKCLIYPVRPVICRLFGVTEGLNCPNGNSAEINGRVIMNDMNTIALRYGVKTLNEVFIRRERDL